MGQPDRFDVVVVGARSGEKGVIELAGALSRKTGITPATIELGILGGGCRIEAGLGKTEAVTAARALQELGAVVDVRPAREDSTPIGIEPDAEASTSDVPAPPPPFAGPGPSGRDSSKDSFESLDMSEFEPDPARSHGRPERAEPERVFGRRPVRQPTPAAIPSGPRPGPRTTPAAPTPPAGGRAASPSPARTTSRSGAPKWPPADGPRASAAAAEAKKVGEPAPVVTAAPEAANDARAFAPPADAKIEIDHAAKPRRGPDTGANLEPVDVAGATIGIAGSARSGPAPAAPRPRGEATMTASNSGPMSASTSGRFPAIADTASGPFAPTPMLVFRGLIVPDRLTSGLISAALALALGFIVAHGWIRRDVSAASETLEDELRDAVADPIGVDAGRLRTPEAIVSDLRDELSDHRLRFFLVWAIVAAPITVAGALLKRTTGASPSITT